MGIQRRVEMESGIDVSVVVCSVRLGAGLEACLASLRRQEHRPFEVIVVSPAPPEFEWDSRLRWVRDPGGIGISAARNLGIAAAKGDVVAFIDDDAAADPGWLRWLVGGFADQKTGGVGGLTLEVDSGMVWSLYNVVGPIGWVHTRCSPRREARGSIIAFPGVNMAVRRVAITDVGGFDPYFTFFREDTDVCLRLARMGWSLALVPGAVVRHGLQDGHHRRHVRFQVSRSRAYFVVKHFGDRLPMPVLLASALLGLAYDLGAVLYSGIRGPGRMRGETGLTGFIRDAGGCIVGWVKGIRAGFKAARCIRT